MFERGQIIKGRLRVDRILGEGGMGVVVAATHVTLGTRVAVKFLQPTLATNAMVKERFLREARASARLRSEHVCRVTDVDTLGDGGAPFLVMELLEGRDLAIVLRGQGPLPIATAVDLVLQACVGIAEAHAAGIVHRDLKPANLFVTQRPDRTPLVKVLDFGIAKAHGEANLALTQTSAVMGSPGYMSPEQLRSSRDVDARSDLWSIGTILYELVSGQPPFIAEAMSELTLRIALDPMPPLPPHVPAPFTAIVSRCLAKDREQRYPNLAALAVALAPFGSASAMESAMSIARMLGAAEASGLVASGQQPSAVPATATTTLGGASGVTVRPEPPRRLVMLGVPLLALITIVLIGFAHRLRARDPDAASTLPATGTLDGRRDVGTERPDAGSLVDAADVVATQASVTTGLDAGSDATPRYVADARLRPDAGASHSRAGSRRVVTPKHEAVVPPPTVPAPPLNGRSQTKKPPAPTTQVPPRDPAGDYRNSRY